MVLGSAWWNGREVPVRGIGRKEAEVKHSWRGLEQVEGGLTDGESDYDSEFEAWVGGSDSAARLTMMEGGLAEVEVPYHDQDSR